MPDITRLEVRDWAAQGGAAASVGEGTWTWECLCSHQRIRNGSLNVQGYCTTNNSASLSLTPSLGQAVGSIISLYLCFKMLRWGLRNVSNFLGATQLACSGKLKSKECKWFPGSHSARIWWHRGLPFSATALSTWTTSLVSPRRQRLPES